jgi:hypothetical protein
MRVMLAPRFGKTNYSEPNEIVFNVVFLVSAYRGKRYDQCKEIESDRPHDRSETSPIFNFNFLDRQASEITPSRKRLKTRPAKAVIRAIFLDVEN